MFIIFGEGGLTVFKHCLAKCLHRFLSVKAIVGNLTKSLVGPYSKYCEISLTSLVTRYQIVTVVSIRGLVLVLCRCQYGCIRQNTREPDVSCHCASVGVLEQRGRGGCRGYSGPATQHRGHHNRLPRALVTSSRGERAQLRHGTLE